MAMVNVTGTKGLNRLIVIYDRYELIEIHMNRPISVDMNIIISIDRKSERFSKSSFTESKREKSWLWLFIILFYFPAIHICKKGTL